METIFNFISYSSSTFPSFPSNRVINLTFRQKLVVLHTISFHVWKVEVRIKNTLYIISLLIKTLFGMPKGAKMNSVLNELKQVVLSMFKFKHFMLTCTTSGKTLLDIICKTTSGNSHGTNSRYIIIPTMSINFQCDPFAMSIVFLQHKYFWTKKMFVSPQGRIIGLPPSWQLYRYTKQSYLLWATINSLEPTVIFK